MASNLSIGFSPKREFPPCRNALPAGLDSATLPGLVTELTGPTAIANMYLPSNIKE